jgi:hypothetical protein
VPREEIDRVIIESYFGISSSPKMRVMAAATVAAAQLLYPAGPHAGVFQQKFVNQLILTTPGQCARAGTAAAGGGRDPAHGPDHPGAVGSQWGRAQRQARIEYKATSGAVFNDTMETAPMVGRSAMRAASWIGRR